MNALSKKTVRLLTILLPSIGVLLIILYSLTAPDINLKYRAISMLLLVGGASFLCGGLGGLLFGIPKKNEIDEGIPKDEIEQTRNVSYIANTNLEEISDWFTKMIIGIGLVEVEKLYKWLITISENISDSINLLGDSSAYVVSLIMYFLIIGFIEGYLGTRVFLPRLLTKADGAT
ncbi:hypothetical protein [Dokdonia sp.]|uniref:hypothetical protein n=1 Tax=Dokdonia sp. TaxID=2024995 RepID=UPI00326446F0